MKQKRKYKNSKKMDKQTRKILILFAVIIVLMIISNLKKIMKTHFQVLDK